MGQWASQVALVVKNLPANAKDVRDVGSVPGLGRSSGGGHGNPLHSLLPRESLGQRSLVGYSPWGRKESDTTERLPFTFTGSLTIISFDAFDDTWFTSDTHVVQW